MPKVSVILSVLNGETFLERCITSVLGQGMEDFELIVVDDGSRDRTWEILERHQTDKRILLLRHPANLGISKSLNEALNVAKGEFVSFIEHDDWWEANKLEAELSCFTKDIGVVFSDYYKVDGQARQRVDLSLKNTSTLRLGQNFICCTASMIRRKSLDAIRENDGKYMDESLWSVWDGDMWARLAPYCGFGHNSVPVTYKQYHEGQLSRGWVHHRDRIRVYSRYNKNPISLVWNLYMAPLARIIQNTLH